MSSSPTPAANAYEKLVEKLLASPHYGERWAPALARRGPLRRHRRLREGHVAPGLGLSRLGHQRVQRDLPYDQFVIEQIAGDLLPNATQDQIVATGFLRHVDAQRGRRRRSRAVPHGRDVRPHGRGRQGVPRPDGRVRQCHNHKFDPISQEEYYQLFAYPQQRPRGRARRLHARRADEDRPTSASRFARSRTSSSRRRPTGESAMATWEASAAEAAGVEDGRGRERGRQLASATFAQKDGSILAQGYAPTKFSTLMRGPSPVKTITGIPPRTAQRPEPAVQRPGPIVHGHLRADRVHRRGRDAEGPGASGRR